MEYRQLGNSGLRVSALSFGTGTFGGSDVELFRELGANELSEATRIVDVCIEAGINLFDTADAYSNGQSEQVLGKALGARRSQVLIATKAYFRMGPGENDLGGSREHLIKACEDSLRRLGTDYIDLYQLHCFDSFTPLDETLSALNKLVEEGKVRYIRCSNYAGWQLMKAIDQKIGTIVWSPLGWGRLTGKVRRNQPLPEVSRLHKTREIGPPVPDERVYSIVEAIDAIAAENGKKVPQIALNWLLHRPTVSSIIVGARNEEQLRQNLESVGWQLTSEQIAKLDAASATPVAYPAWFQWTHGGDRNQSPI
jgi:aryl-alcohol dehydrogenase-like predicted oxidoreductase